LLFLARYVIIIISVAFKSLSLFVPCRHVFCGLNDPGGVIARSRHLRPQRAPPRGRRRHPTTSLAPEAVARDLSLSTTAPHVMRKH